jgi:Uma2 family endonuclease
MSVVLLDPDWAARVLAEREADGEHVHDEVWDGVTYIMPQADNEHDDLVGFFRFVFRTVFDPVLGHRTHGSVNITDRPHRWKQNYRAPDVALFLAGNPAQDRGTHWLGGPDSAIEIVSPGDRSRDKLDFYAGVGVREVLVLDRNPWRLEVYQSRRGRMRSKGAIAPGDGSVLTSAIGPLTFQLLRGRPRPKVKITHAESGQEWVG